MKWMELSEFSLGPSAADLSMLASGVPHEWNWPTPLPAKNKILYKEITVAELQGLRCFLYKNKKVGNASGLLEATMRFCEVNLWKLQKRMVEKWGHKYAATLTVITAAYLLEASLVTSDLRFLNTVLKMQHSHGFPPKKKYTLRTSQTLALAKVIVEVNNRKIKELGEIGSK